jgi:hypothetical protein
MKMCSKCELEKDDSEFNKHRGGLGSYCKVCLRKYHSGRNATKEQREFRSKRNKLCRDNLRRQVIDYLKEHPCVICKESDIVVLEFDHLRDKSFV